MIETTLGIEGMMCGMCEAHVNDAIRKAFDVDGVKSSRKRKRCVITSEEPLDEGRLREVVAKTGYELCSIDVQTRERRKGLWSRR